MTLFSPPSPPLDLKEDSLKWREFKNGKGQRREKRSRERVFRRISQIVIKSPMSQGVRHWEPTSASYEGNSSGGSDSCVGKGAHEGGRLNQGQRAKSREVIQ
ncbi:hypothetical protein VNO77_27202 [Canavalia gladiata]|uniref:Uncharacterized protein n=1 Tax=Canavalia gladiata TaxID=3824 RepID=A0AAN9KU94_CANGL